MTAQVAMSFRLVICAFKLADTQTLTGTIME